ncbi:MAG: hypothetical protein PSV35_00525, partial [bacterium]|nr:hypothetical protein [bacterium]
VSQQNIILYGTLANNSWIKFVAPNLSLQLNGSSRILKSSLKEIEVGGAHFTGLIELIPSPRSEKNHILVITGDSDVALSQAVLTLVNDKSRIALNGTIALINADHSIGLLKSDDVTYVSLFHQTVLYGKSIIQNSLFYVKKHPQILIYLLVFIVPLYIFLRKRKK